MPCSTEPRTSASNAAATDRIDALRRSLVDTSTPISHPPDADALTIGRRSAAFAAELGAFGEVGTLLARRAALLSVRMERAFEQGNVAVAAHVAGARDQFDRDLRDVLAGQVAELSTTDDIPRSRVALEATPDGLVHLIGVWTKLQASLLDAKIDPDAAREAHTRAAVWLGSTDADLAPRIDAEIHRLRAGMAEAVDRIARSRDQAETLARLDLPRSVQAIRRVEATAERGMYRAIRGIADLRKIHATHPLLPEPTVFTPPVPAPSRSEPRPLGSFRPEMSDALGSFRVGVTPPPEPALGSFRAGVTPPETPVGRDRTKRPDLRKLVGNRR